MNLLEELISKNLDYFPELSEYKEVVIVFLQDHKIKRPDMCIEGCKSLIEGLSKFIYFHLNNGNINHKDWKDYKFSQKYKKVVEILKLDGYENEFVEINSQLVHKLGEIRNERGDISHGQSYPKDSYSDTEFARFIILWTEGLCYFLLSRYIMIKQKQKEEESMDVYNNEQFEEFDNYLDSLSPDIKFIHYSKALKEQDPYQYELLMDDYYKNK